MADGAIQVDFAHQEPKAPRTPCPRLGCRDLFSACEAEAVPIALGTAGGHGGGVQPKAQVVQHVLQLLLKGHSATRLTAPTWVGSFSQTCNLTQRNFSVLTVRWGVRAPTTVIQGALRHCAANARVRSGSWLDCDSYSQDWSRKCRNDAQLPSSSNTKQRMRMTARTCTCRTGRRVAAQAEYNPLAYSP